MSDTFRTKIEAYANDYWWRPCKDNTVWMYYAGINYQTEIARLRLKPSEWSGVFLKYPDPKYVNLEGYYLIHTTNMSKVVTENFDANKFPERVMLASWYDSKDKEDANAEVQSKKPNNNGLNDCAHFVTQCLLAGGIDVQTVAVPQLLQKLRALSDTKILALTVPADKAENIINGGVMDKGDVILYSSSPTSHAHSVIYMGNAKIAMHTWANHPKHSTLQGDWKASASSEHPLVTLIHFGRDDHPSAIRSSLIGWWEVMWRGAKYFYYFKENGVAEWTQDYKGGTKPLIRPQGSGYWFQDGISLKICWTSTGSFEKVDAVIPTSMSKLVGKWNGLEDITFTKLN